MNFSVALRLFILTLALTPADTGTDCVSSGKGGRILFTNATGDTLTFRIFINQDPHSDIIKQVVTTKDTKTPVTFCGPTPLFDKITFFYSHNGQDRQQDLTDQTILKLPTITAKKKADGTLEFVESECIKGQPNAGTKIIANTVNFPVTIQLFMHDAAINSFKEITVPASKTQEVIYCGPTATSNNLDKIVFLYSYTNKEQHQEVTNTQFLKNPYIIIDLKPDGTLALTSANEGASEVVTL